MKVDNTNKDILNYEKEKLRIKNNKNKLKNKNFCNNNDNRILRGKNITINNYLSNNKINMPYDNIEYKIKLQKIQKRNNLSDNKIFMKIGNEKYKYIIPKLHNTKNIESFEKFRKLNILNKNIPQSPIIKNNNLTNKNSKKFLRKNEAKK